MAQTFKSNSVPASKSTAPTAKRLSYLVTLLSVLAISPYARAVKAQDYNGACHLSGMNGFDQEQKRAKEFVPSVATSDPSKCTIFVTRKGSSICAFSNFQTEDYDFPAKVASPDIDNLEAITLNILDYDQSSAESRSKLYDLHQKSVSFRIDQALFSNDGTLPFDTAGAEKISVVLADGSPPKKLVSIESVRGPPKWAVEVSDNIFVRMTPLSQPATEFNNLDAAEFNVKQCAFVSLVNDTATRDGIAASRLKEISIPLSDFDSSSLEHAFTVSANKTVFLLGHVEDSSFVTQNSDGRTELLRVPLADIRSLATKNNCTVFYLGCYSASAAPLGVNQEFNSLDAVHSLEKALAAHNYREFLQMFASPELSLVLDENALSKRQVALSLHRRDGDPTTGMLLSAAVGSLLIEMSATTGDAMNSKVSQRATIRRIAKYALIGVAALSIFILVRRWNSVRPWIMRIIADSSAS